MRSRIPGSTMRFQSVRSMDAAASNAPLSELPELAPESSASVAMSLSTPDISR